MNSNDFKCSRLRFSHFWTSGYSIETTTLTTHIKTVFPIFLCELSRTFYVWQICKHFMFLNWPKFTLFFKTQHQHRIIKISVEIIKIKNKHNRKWTRSKLFFKRSIELINTWWYRTINKNVYLININILETLKWS